MRMDGWSVPRMNFWTSPILQRIEGSQCLEINQFVVLTSRSPTAGNSHWIFRSSSVGSDIREGRHFYQRSPIIIENFITPSSCKTTSILFEIFSDGIRMHRSPSQLTFFRWSTASAAHAVVSCPRTLFFRQKNLTMDKISSSLEQLIPFRLYQASATIRDQHLPESSVSIHLQPIYFRTLRVHSSRLSPIRSHIPHVYLLAFLCSVEHLPFAIPRPSASLPFLFFLLAAISHYQSRFQTFWK